MEKENVKIELTNSKICNSEKECYNFTKNVDEICDEYSKE